MFIFHGSKFKRSKYGRYQIVLEKHTLPLLFRSMFVKTVG